MKTVSKLLFLFVILAMSFVLVGHVLADNSVPPTPQPSIQAQIDELMAMYNQALSQELQTGETTLIDTARGKQKVLTGKSEAKLKNLWKETSQKIDILTGRPKADRDETAKHVQALERGPVAYLYHSRIPYYDSSAVVEYYQGGKNTYTIDIRTGQVVEVMPLNIEDDQRPILSEEALE